MSESLRYNISNWDQLTKCRSNNSADLYITVDHVFNDKRLNGTVIRLTHSDFGLLFACTVNATGTILTPDNNSGIISEFTTEQILAELKKFGFDITFNLEAGLSGDQIDYLMTLDALGFDKIRTLDVYNYNGSDKCYFQYVVAFNIEKCPKWVQQSYCEYEKTFLDALNGGGAMNLTYISQTKQFNWNWLDYVANIKDIIENNSYNEVE